MNNVHVKNPHNVLKICIYNNNLLIKINQLFSGFFFKRNRLKLGYDRHFSRSIPQNEYKFARNGQFEG